MPGRVPERTREIPPSTTLGLIVETAGPESFDSTRSDGLGKGGTTMLDAGFVAAVLEGFEGTLDEVLYRGTPPELSADLVALQARTEALRVSIEPPKAKTE